MFNKLIISFLAIVFIGCQSPGIELDPVPIYGPGDPMYLLSYGQVSALKNGWEWRADAFGRKWFHPALLKKYLYIRFISYEDGIFRRELISFGPMKFSPGIYNITDETVFLNDIQLTTTTKTFYATAQSDGDVLEDVYVPDTTRIANFIAITYVDTNENIVRGSFDMTFRIKEPRVNALNPKIVKFSAGSFEAKFQN